MQHEPEALIRFDKKHRLLLVFLTAAFITGLSFKLHGYSISCWKNYLPGIQKSEILLGQDRPIRSDDWAVEIPLMLSQRAHAPPYPLVNKNIGTGLNMLLFSKMPVQHAITIFKPTVWGFFIGKDFGLSWMWWTLVLGSFYVYFLLFLLISRNRFFLSLLGGLFLLFSPYFQFWSFHSMEIPLFMGLVAISCVCLCYGRTKRMILSHALILTWSLSCFTLHYVYPPFQVTCGYLLMFFVAGYLIHHGNQSILWTHIRYKLFGLSLSLAVVLLGVLIFHDAAKDAISVLADTVYPGKRRYLGGRYGLSFIFRDTFFTTFLGALKGNAWGPLRNICESALFWFLFPVIAVACIWQDIRSGNRFDGFSVSLILYMILILFYVVIGFPRALAKYSLLDWMQESRALLGLGIANALLLVRFLSRGPVLAYRKGLVLSVFWTLFLILLGLRLADSLKNISNSEIMLLSLLNGLVAFYVMVRKGPMGIAILAGISFLTTAWFNPLVSGGTAYLYENPLSRKVLEIDRREKANTNWAVYGQGSWVLANLLRVLGVKSVSGTHPCPQPALWESLDPQHRFATQHNRYAHVEFMPANERGLHFSNPVTDVLVVHTDPRHLPPQWGITHLLVAERHSLFYDRHPGLTRLFTMDDIHIYRVSPP